MPQKLDARHPRVVHRGQEPQRRAGRRQADPGHLHADRRWRLVQSAARNLHRPLTFRVRGRDPFYVETVPAVGELAVVDGDEGFHAATVRRIRPGGVAGDLDGAGAVAECVVESAGNAALTAW